MELEVQQRWTPMYVHVRMIYMYKKSCLSVCSFQKSISLIWYWRSTIQYSLQQDEIRNILNQWKNDAIVWFIIMEGTFIRGRLNRRTLVVSFFSFAPVKWCAFIRNKMIFSHSWEPTHTHLQFKLEAVWNGGKKFNCPLAGTKSMHILCLMVHKMIAHSLGAR